ncbi:hypothetical protein PFISCL1PPCAC_9759 [Pristionchus fissidentatus]|uniref:Methyltransferase n=1 Tax=Pristionchus fissidentatus TaxID=1538716 RepID=A0AAV5VK50_9BILA|nr:hypothetical protein PFISCL1PPCAC_9759 [Pristionchus fissidentatus]
MSNQRPEHTGPPELYYNETESSKYASNSHIVKIQTDMAERAIELLALPEDKVGYLLDLGCGSGISGDVITAHGHVWVGLDVSLPMLQINKEDDEDPTKDLILRDMGSGMPFRAGTFDGAISISAIQWLCHANSSDQNPRKRLHRFFQSLYACMGRGTRAVFQFYPENEQQSDLIMSQAMRAGFNGGLVVDFPTSTKAKKVYLVLMTGGVQQLPKALTEESEAAERGQVQNIGRRVFQTGKKGKERIVKGSKAWIDAKRERAQKQGRDVREESKYSGRKRKTKW